MAFPLWYLARKKVPLSWKFQLSLCLDWACQGVLSLPVSAWPDLSILVPSCCFPWAALLRLCRGGRHRAVHLPKEEENPLQRMSTSSTCSLKCRWPGNA